MMDATGSWKYTLTVFIKSESNGGHSSAGVIITCLPVYTSIDVYKKKLYICIHSIFTLYISTRIHEQIHFSKVIYDGVRNKYV